MSRKNNDSGLTCCQWKHDGSSDKPRTIVQRKTWLDECAMMTAQGLMSNLGAYKIDHYEYVAKASYDLADAMLAEKMKREAKG